MLILPPSDHFMNVTWRLPRRTSCVHLSLATTLPDSWDFLLLRGPGWHWTADMPLLFQGCCSHREYELSCHFLLCFLKNDKVLSNVSRTSSVLSTVMEGGDFCPYRGPSPHYPLCLILLQLLNLLLTPVILSFIELWNLRGQGQHLAYILSHSLVWYLSDECQLNEWMEGTVINQGFRGGSDGKESACNVGDRGLIPRSVRSPGEGKSYPLQ